MGTNTLGRGGWTQWTPDEARKALVRWKKSGQPLATFARQLGVSSTKLRWWRNRLGEWNAPSESDSVRLVPAVVTSAATAAPVMVRIRSAKAVRDSGDHAVAAGLSTPSAA